MKPSVLLLLFCISSTTFSCDWSYWTSTSPIPASVLGGVSFLTFTAISWANKKKLEEVLLLPDKDPEKTQLLVNVYPLLDYFMALPSTITADTWEKIVRQNDESVQMGDEEKALVDKQPAIINPLDIVRKAYENATTRVIIRTGMTMATLFSGTFLVFNTILACNGDRL